MTRQASRRGTSAHRQLAHYVTALDEGLQAGEALSGVIDWLAGETLRDL